MRMCIICRDHCTCMKHWKRKMGTMGILLIIDDGVYICIYKLYSYVLKNITQHTFVYDSYFSTKDESECCGAIIDIR